MSQPFIFYSWHQIVTLLSQIAILCAFLPFRRGDIRCFPEAIRVRVRSRKSKKIPQDDRPRPDASNAGPTDGHRPKR